MSAMPAVDLIGMAGDEDWILRPVLRGLIKGESLLDCSVDLEYIALLNEAIDVDSENRFRLDKAVRSG